ncbi:MAG: molybdopterin molybdotransferase MoeA [Kangiellaceae bacterium]
MNDNQSNYTNHYMISFQAALDLISQHRKELTEEEIDTNVSKGRILAEDIFSPVEIPPFNNSAMDGYAVNHNDLKGATKDCPIRLQLAGLTAAGDAPSSSSDCSGTAWKIMTGAAVPSGYDSIIPVENTELSDDGITVKCFSQPKPNAHIRTSGEDFSKGSLVLQKQRIINSNRIMALASLGVDKIKVKKLAKVVVFSTGKELVDDLKQDLKPGQIYNSNMPYILEFLAELPVDCYNAGTNYDDVAAYETALKEQLNNNADLIISTGAVSMGDFDFIPQTIIKMGGEIIFHKARIRPGKPILFAKFPNGTFYFGLPGNPISAAIGLRFFVTHILNQLMGLPSESPIKSKLLESRNKKQGFTNILKANNQTNQSASLETTILNGQESFKIHPLIDANGWAVLEESMSEVNQGNIIDFYPSNLIYD